MELDISERKAVLPKILVGIKQTYQMVIDEETQDVLKETERESKANGGKFKQYTLFLLNTSKELCEANYLFAHQLRNLIQHYGKDTKAWAGQCVELTAAPRQVGDAEYFDLVLSPIATDHVFIEEKVA